MHVVVMNVLFVTSAHVSCLQLLDSLTLFHSCCHKHVSLHGKQWRKFRKAQTNFEKAIETSKSSLYIFNIPYTRIFSSDKNFDRLNYVGITFRGLRTTC